MPHIYSSNSWKDTIHARIWQWHQLDWIYPYVDYMRGDRLTYYVYYVLYILRLKSQFIHSSSEYIDIMTWMDGEVLVLIQWYTNNTLLDEMSE